MMETEETDFTNKLALMEVVDKNWKNLEYASEQLKDDKEVVLEAIKQNGNALEFASKELKNDRNVVIEAIRQNGNALEFASDELKNDTEVVLEAIRKRIQLTSELSPRQNWKNLRHAGEDLRNDRDFVLLAIIQNGNAIEYASEELKNDKEIVIEAIKQDGLSLKFALEHVSEELRNDKEVILEAIKQDGFALKFASKRLKNDKDVVLAAVKQDGSSFRFASFRLKNDKEIALEAIKQDESHLTYASEDLKHDKHFVLEAVKKNGRAIKYAGGHLKDDEKFFLQIVKRNGLLLRYASIILKSDKEVVLEAVRQNGNALEYSSSELKNEKEVVLEAVKRHGSSLKHASRKLKNDKDVVVEALKQNGWTSRFALKFASEQGEELGKADNKEGLTSNSFSKVVFETLKQNAVSLKFASERIRNNERFVLDGFRLVSEILKNEKDSVLEQVERDEKYLTYASKELQNDKRFVLEAVKRNGNAFQFVSEEFRKNKEIVLEAVKQNGSLLSHASEKLKNNIVVVQEAVEESPLSLEFIGREFLARKVGLRFCFDFFSKSERFMIHRFPTGFVKELLELDEDMFFEFININDRHEMLKFVTIKPSLIMKLKKFIGDKEFISNVSQENARVLEYIDPSLFLDFGFLSHLPKPNRSISAFFIEESKCYKIQGNWKEALFFSLISQEFLPNSEGTMFEKFNDFIPNIIGAKHAGFLKCESFSTEEISVFETEIRNSFHSEITRVSNELFGRDESQELFHINGVGGGLDRGIRNFVSKFVHRSSVQVDREKIVFVGVCRKSGPGVEFSSRRVGFGVEFTERTSGLFAQTKKYFKVFEGTFSNNQRNGKGIEYEIFRERSEPSFEGMFKNDKRHGRGEAFDPESGDVERGIWVRGTLDPGSVFSFSCPLIPYEDVEKQLKASNFIAKGGNGMVYKVKCSSVPFLRKMRRNIGDFAALKIMKMKSAYNLQIANRMIRRGIGLCFSVNSPYILESYCIVKGKNEVGYIMRLCEKSIDEMIEEGSIKMSEKMRILHHTALGMVSLHSKLLIHRDLKWGNVLMDSEKFIKLCDFDTVKEDEVFWRLRSMAQSSGVGTAGFRPPEVIQDKKYTMKSDVYAFGLMIYSLLWEEMSPYSTQYECTCGAKLVDILKTDDRNSFSEFEKHILNCNFRPLLTPNDVRKYNPLLIDLMRECWDANPFVRPTFEEIVKRLVLVKEEKPFVKLTLKYPSHPGVSDQVMYIEKPFQKETVINWVEKKFEPPTIEEEEMESEMKLLEEDSVKTQVLFLEHPQYGTIHDDNDLKKFIREESNPAINVTLNHVNEDHVINRIRRKVDIEEFERLEERCAMLEKRSVVSMKRVMILNEMLKIERKKFRSFLDKNNLLEKYLEERKKKKRKRNEEYEEDEGEEED